MSHEQQIVTAAEQFLDASKLSLLGHVFVRKGEEAQVRTRNGLFSAHTA